MTLSRHWGHGYFQAAHTFSKSTDATSSGNTALNTAYNASTIAGNHQQIRRGVENLHICFGNRTPA